VGPVGTIPTQHSGNCSWEVHGTKGLVGTAVQDTGGLCWNLSRHQGLMGSGNHTLRSMARGTSQDTVGLLEETKANGNNENHKTKEKRSLGILQ